MSDNNFDDALFYVLKECKTLPVFLNAIFGFLNRRTDFYIEAADQQSPVGLPKGFAEEFVKQAFFKWKQLAQPQPVPEAIADVEVETCVLEEVVTNEQIVEDFIPASEKKDINVIENKFTTSESYNGSVFDSYTWSQTITDVDVIVKVPENITTKHLSINILPQSISVKIKNTSVLLDGDLCQKVKHHDAIWSLDRRKLEIHLDKVSEMWWDCLVQNEPKLDLSKIDCSRPFEELPDDAQAKIEELKWNQERKRLGLPTSEELVLQQKFGQLWNGEGSPLKIPINL